MNSVPGVIVVGAHDAIDPVCGQLLVPYDDHDFQAFLRLSLKQLANVRVALGVVIAADEVDRCVDGPARDVDELFGLLKGAV